MTSHPRRFTFGFEPVPAQPTDRHVETALSFLDPHRRVCVPEPVCHWCLRKWPCPAAQWAQRVLKRSAKDTSTQGSLEQPP